jgi:hypothetical protein
MRSWDRLIVIDIAGHDPRYGGECDQFGDLDVLGKQVAAWFRDTSRFSQPAQASSTTRRSADRLAGR